MIEKETLSLNLSVQLASADPTDWPVAPGWASLTQDFFVGAAGTRLLAFLRQRLAAGGALPSHLDAGHGHAQSICMLIRSIWPLPPPKFAMPMVCSISM